MQDPLITTAFTATSEDDVTELDEIVVTHPGIGNVDPWDGGGYPWWPGGGAGGDPWPGGGGGGGGFEGPDPCDCDCPSDAGDGIPNELRGAAADAADQIKEQNWENQEYGGFLYRDAITGEIRVGVITGGAIGQWTPSADNMSGIYEYGQIVGVIHSQGPNIPGTNHNQPSEGDWAAFRQLIELGVDQNLVMYVVGADGEVREYTSDDEGSSTDGNVVSGC